MGQEADPQVRASFGVYDNPELQVYVRDLGMSIARNSERPHLPWKYTVIDDPIVNAFALPGGFIYISRGILAYFESEAELMAVLGHETGHVTARHSAAQMSRQQLGQIGLGVGMILAPGLQDFAGLANSSLQLLYLKNSRGAERQADELGFRYMRQRGYDAREMVKVFNMLGRVTAAAGGPGVPNWQSTHPTSADREAKIQAQIVKSGVDFSTYTVRQDEYLRRLDGLVFGTNPRHGFFRGQRFMHPDLRFEIEFPTEWQTVNQQQAVLGQSPRKDAMMEVALAEGGGTPRDLARGFVGQKGVSGGSVVPGKIHGLTSASADFSVRTNQQALRGNVTYVEYGDNVFRLLGVSTSRGWGRYRQAILGAFQSFDRLTEMRALTAQPMRVRIVELEKPMTLTQFNREYPSAISLQKLAIINQVQPGALLEAGRLMKRIEGDSIP